METREHKIKSLVRPGSVVVLLVFFMFLVLADGNIGHFTVREGYFPILETVLVTVVIAFFGSRGVEKTAQEWNRPRPFQEKENDADFE